MDAQKILKSYTDQLSQARKTLTELRERAETIRKAQAARESVDEQVAAFEEKATELQSERGSLQTEYTTAMFEGDASKASETMTRRKAIDKELEQLQTNVCTLRESAVELDPIEVAQLAAEKDSLHLPSYSDVIESIETELEREKMELSREVREVAISGPYSKDAYRTRRMEIDRRYRLDQEREMVYAKKDAERNEQLRKLGTGSNTDVMESNRGAARRVEPEMTVTAAGEPVGRYSLDH